MEEILAEDIPGMDIDNKEEPGYELVSKVTVAIVYNHIHLEIAYKFKHNQVRHLLFTDLILEQQQ